MPVLRKAGLLIALASILALAVALTFAKNHLTQPLSIPNAGYVVAVPPGSSLELLADRLAAEKILAHPRTLTIYGRLTGKAARIKAGEYDVIAGTTPFELLNQLVAGRVKLHSLTVVEGWTTHDLIRAIRRHPAIKQTLAPNSIEDLATVLRLPTSTAEGWFFPDTYHFPRDTSDQEVLERARARMTTMLQEAWTGRANGLPLKNPYEALILASIVEKETALDRERTQIAGVFIRRLKAGMKLQTDPTVIYGLGDDYSGNLTRRHLEKDGPYNTYTRFGLPPSPISLPGAASLLAAVQPDESEALYFVASGRGDGSHVFSGNLRDHNAAVRQYIEASRNKRQ